MSAEIAQPRIDERARISPRARIVLALGPLTSVAGIVWAVAQPWRLTLLHPHGQGFWWLLVEPPLLAIGVGIVFALAIAPSLIEDLEDHATTR